MEQLTCILFFPQYFKVIFSFLNATSLFHSHKSFGADHYETSDHKPGSIPTNRSCDEESHLPSVLPTYLPIYGSTDLVDLGRFFSFLICTQSVGFLGREISPSQVRYLHTVQHKQNKSTQTSMPRVWFEPTIPLFERAKMAHTLDSAATVIDSDLWCATKLSQFDDAADGSIHSWTLSRDITRTVRGNRTRFMVIGFVLICSTIFIGVKNPSLNLKSEVDLDIS
jgi:hypothetical protein